MDKGTAQKLLEKTRQDYEQIAQEFSDTRVHPWQELENLVKQYVKDGDKILDVGCGNGRLCELFRGRQIEYVGIDNSQTLIERAKEKFSAQSIQSFDKLRTSFSISDALDFQFKDKKFDIVFCVALLHHIPSEEFRQQVLKNIRRVLKPGGYLLMTNWNLWQIGVKKTIWQYFLQKNKITKDILKELGLKDVITFWQNKYPLYYYAFTPREIKRLLRDSGFKILDNCYVKKGAKAHWWNGYNIVTVATKV